MALTLAGTVTAVRRKVEAAEPRNRPYMTVLTNSPGGAGTTFDVGDGDAWQVGDLVEGPAGELSLVTSISTDTLTVTRAQGEQAAETLASGDTMRKNPRFTYDQVVGAIDEVRLETESRLFNLKSETIAYTVQDWYDMTDTTAEEVFSVWYLEDGDFRVPHFIFNTDPANDQPKIHISSAGFTGNVFVNYSAPYADITEYPDRLLGMVSAGAVYKLMGGAAIVSSSDPGKRTDRTVQGGAEARDSYWFLREYTRLRDDEVAFLNDKIQKLPKNRLSQRARRFIS